MNKTLAFVNLDMHLIKTCSKEIIYLITIGVLLGWALKSTNILSWYLIVTLMLVATFPFSLSNRNGMETLYGTLALTRRSIVIGRYLTILMLQILYIMLSLIFCFIFSIATGISFSFTNELSLSCLGFLMVSIMIATQFPFYFWLGFDKARMISNAPLLLVLLVAIKLIGEPDEKIVFEFSITEVLANTSLITDSVANPLVLCAVMIAVGLIFLMISCLLSCKIYSKKDI